MGWGQKRRDSLHLPDAGAAGAQHFSLPSAADNHHGRATKQWDWCIRGTAAAMPASAFVREAGSRQRKRGKLPKQQWRALHGISVSARAWGGSTENKGSAGQSLACVTLSSQPATCLLPQALATAPVQLLRCQRHPPTLLLLEEQRKHLGVRLLCWRGHW